MKNFIEGFLSLFHLKTLKSVVKNYWSSILIFVSTFLIFFAVSFFFIKLLDNVIIKNIFNSLSKRWLYLSPLYDLNKSIGNPLLGFFYPFILYLSYIVSMILAGIFTGSILDPLSKKTQENYPYQCSHIITRTGTKKFFFNITEELKLLFFNITFIVGLFFLSYLAGVGTTFSKVINYILLNGVLIFINGLIFLAYSYLRWGHSYLTAAKIVLKSPGRIIGHGIIITAFFYLIALIIKNVPYSTLSFGILFALNALILPLAVVSGTNNAVEYSKKLDQFPIKKGIISRIFELVITISAIIIIITGVEIYSKSKTKMALMKCNYHAKNFKIEFAETNSNPIDSILRRFKIKSSPVVTFNMEIYNPTSKDIHIFDFHINMYFNNKDIANIQVNGFKLEKLTNKNIDLKVKLSPTKIGYELLKSIIKKQNIKFQIIGIVKIDTWLGKIPIMFSIINT